MENAKKVLFIDRDGTLIVEPPVDFQVDSLEKLAFCPKAIGAMSRIAGLGFELAMVTNQDGLGTASFPEETFWGAHNKMLDTLAGEGVVFDKMFIDRSFPEENLPTRKPGTAMLTEYIGNPAYDLAGSFVIGDRVTDMQLAGNLGAKGILYAPKEAGVQLLREAGLTEVCALITDDWNEIYAFLRLGDRRVTVCRRTGETDVRLTLDLDGEGTNSISTGLGFFDHMLDQLTHHSPVSMELTAKGDLQVDEHHTVEDVAIVLGEAIRKALGNKLGIGRYGFALPMDECDAAVVIDFGGRIDFRWEVEFRREKIGDMPTELFEHFFKSLAQAAQCNLHVKAEGTNEHHKIEGVFKAFARALKMAVERNAFQYKLPSSKGVL